MAQESALKFLKRFGTVASYNRPAKGQTERVSLVAFSDAVHSYEVSQQCYIVGLVVGPVERGSVFHLLTWASQKSRRPVKSTADAEILAAGESIDEIVMLREALEIIYNVQLTLMVLVDTKDLYHSLDSQHNSVDRSVCGDVNAIRF